jgi:hypothetical protein
LNYKTELSQPLLDAYNSTTYKAGDYTISIGEIPDDLVRAMSGDLNTYGFITAWNPYSNELSLEQNDKRNSELEQCLKEKQLRYLAGYGCPENDSWDPEASFLVLDINKEDLLSLAKRFEQNAVVFGTKSTPAMIIVTR